jgi:hypothetical protein
MADAGHEQTLVHLRLLAGLPGYWELRALHRDTYSPPGDRFATALQRRSERI